MDWELHFKETGEEYQYCLSQGVNLTEFTIRFYLVGKEKLITSPFECWFNINYKN